MSLPDLCIRRPVFTWMLTLSLVVFGLLGYARLGVLDDPRENAVVQRIREEGYCVWPDLYSGNELASLQQEAGRLLELGQNAQREQDNVRIVNAQGLSPAIDRGFARHPLFARIAGAYYDAPIQPFQTIISNCDKAAILSNHLL